MAVSGARLSCSGDDDEQQADPDGDEGDGVARAGSGSTVALINGAQECNVFWQVGSSATLGTGSVFVGNILALTSITVTTGVTVHGRALARNGAVTLDTDTFTKPTCALAPPTTTTTTTQPATTTTAAPATTTATTGPQTGPIATLPPTGAPSGTPLLPAALALTLGAVAIRYGRAKKLPQR